MGNLKLSETYALLYFNAEGDIEITRFNKKGIIEVKNGEIESGFDDVGVHAVILLKYKDIDTYQYAAEIDDGMKDDMGYNIAEDLLDNHLARLNEFFEHWDARDKYKSNKVFDKLLNEMNNDRENS